MVTMMIIESCCCSYEVADCLYPYHYNSEVLLLVFLLLNMLTVLPKA